MWIDVGKLIREHVPDKNGKTLPADLSSGSFEFRDLTDIGVGSLFEGKLIYDKTYGHVTYGCSLCCVYNAPFLAFNPLGIPFTGDSQNGVTAYENCSGIYLDVSNQFLYGWHTGSTAIATVNYMGTHHGAGVGSTTSNTSGYLTHSYARNCPAARFTPSGGANVQVPVPTKVLPIATLSQGVIICSNGQGWNRIFTNQLQDQFGRGYPHAGIVMADILSFGTNQLGLSPETGSATTNSNGSWGDFYADCTSACPSSGQSNALQTWTYNGIPLAHANTVIYKCTSITIDGF
ncbi:MAG TPA: hypothetical protein VHF01_03365 [Candidatus Acidoferrum sp.]|nr:hypothetical protein [Candidatus Acidoferrum sp.]